ncbi:unnamed protein product [Lactuca virosa]|uniref:Uncharacterized protein n=1 Tax=Lactuca virosa TaxID=75947 RepID=A0AAU9PT48_9ASTR|nr:unnamed protein product [Lactuca virosa]
MTLLDSPTIDRNQQRMKGNLEDFIYDALSSSDLVSVRMKKDDPKMKIFKNREHKSLLLKDLDVMLQGSKRALK